MNPRRSLFIAPRVGGLAEQIALHVRKRIFCDFMSVVKNMPPNIRVLDIGVTSDNSRDSNFLESLYPYPENITAVGLEDASFLESEYPGLKFVRADACNLPFRSQEFDIAFCSAVIEHVGSLSRQEDLIAEAMRVAELVMITTPNRWYPLEFHTLTPFLHWLPKKLFRYFLKITGRSFFANESNLNLLTEGEMKRMISELGFKSTAYNQKLLGIVSNLVYLVHR